MRWLDSADFWVGGRVLDGEENTLAFLGTRPTRRASRIAATFKGCKFHIIKLKGLVLRTLSLVLRGGAHERVGFIKFLFFLLFRRLVWPAFPLFLRILFGLLFRPSLPLFLLLLKPLFVGSALFFLLHLGELCLEPQPLPPKQLLDQRLVLLNGFVQTAQRIEGDGPWVFRLVSLLGVFCLLLRLADMAFLLRGVLCVNDHGGDDRQVSVLGALFR